MIRGILATLWSWVVTIVVIVLIVYAIGWFINNSTMAGTQVGSFFTAIQTFITSAISASPLG